MFRSGQVHCQAEHCLVVVAHQFLEGSTVSVLRLANEHGVVNAAWYLT
jgi:hypothetical protein